MGAVYSGDRGRAARVRVVTADENRTIAAGDTA